MRIDVELKSSYGRLLEREPVFISDEVFKLRLQTGYQLSDVIVVFKNGDANITKHYSNVNEFVIPQEVLHAGTLNVTVMLLSLGVEVKTWVIEPIVFREVNDGLSALSELEELRAQIASLTERVAELESKNEIAEEHIMELQKQVGDLWQIQES